MPYYQPKINAEALHPEAQTIDHPTYLSKGWNPQHQLYGKADVGYTLFEVIFHQSDSRPPCATEDINPYLERTLAITHVRLNLERAMQTYQVGYYCGGRAMGDDKWSYIVKFQHIAKLTAQVMGDATYWGVKCTVQIRCGKESDSFKNTHDLLHDEDRYEERDELFDKWIFCPQP